MKKPALALLFILCSSLSISAERKFVQPELIIDDRFTIELAAAPPLVEHPMLATIDPQGRMFISESDGQNLQKAELLKQRPRFVRMLEDTDRDGVYDKSTIFADKMVMPEGALWHQGALYIISSPYLWRLEDTDGDGVADRRDKILGYMEFDGRANQHGPWLGPNGLLYFTGGIFGYDLVGTDGVHAAKGTSAGVFSCRLDGSDIRVVCHAGINPVEIAFTPRGDMLGTCAIFDSVGGRHDSLSHWVHGGQYGPKDYGSTREGSASLKRTGYRLRGSLGTGGAGRAPEVQGTTSRQGIPRRLFQLPLQYPRGSPQHPHPIRLDLWRRGRGLSPLPEHRLPPDRRNGRP